MSTEGQSLREIPEGKTCNECGHELTHDNITQSRLEKYIYVCSDCITAKMDELRGSYRYEKETPAYNIRRSTKVAAPHLLSKDLSVHKTNFELLTSAFKDTEQFRVDKMMAVMLGRGVEAKNRKAAINYLLKVFDKLTKPQCISLINAVHRLIGKVDTPDDIKVKLAEELNAFMNGGKSKSDQSISTYEQMLHEDGETVLEDD